MSELCQRQQKEIKDLVESERVRIAESSKQLRTEFNTAVWNADNPEFYGNK